MFELSLSSSLSLVAQLVKVVIFWLPPKPSSICEADLVYLLVLVGLPLSFSFSIASSSVGSANSLSPRPIVFKLNT